MLLQLANGWCKVEQCQVFDVSNQDLLTQDTNPKCINAGAAALDLLSVKGIPLTIALIPQTPAILSNFHASPTVRCWGVQSSQVVSLMPQR